jgi:hypothetical protein
MRVYTLLLLFLSLSNYCLAQSEYTIKGQILNEKTGEPISYSNIGIPEKYIDGNWARWFFQPEITFGH